MDYELGPIPCKACGSPMRPKSRRAEGVFRDAVVHRGRGLCRQCHRKATIDGTLNKPEKANEPASKNTPPQTRTLQGSNPEPAGDQVKRISKRYPINNSKRPLVHEEFDALAQFMHLLDREGMTLLMRPHVKITHERDAYLTITANVLIEGD